VLVSNPSFGFLLKSLKVDSMGCAQRKTISERKLLFIGEDMNCEYLMKQSGSCPKASIKKTSILPRNVMKNFLFS